MHTTEIKRGAEVIGHVNHDSDWSGEARLVWTDDDGAQHERWIPGPLVLALARTIGVADAAEWAREALDYYASVTGRPV